MNGSELVTHGILTATCFRDTGGCYGLIFFQGFDFYLLLWVSGTPIVSDDGTVSKGKLWVLSLVIMMVIWGGLLRSTVAGSQ